MRRTRGRLNRLHRARGACAQATEARKERQHDRDGELSDAWLDMQRKSAKASANRARVVANRPAPVEIPVRYYDPAQWQAEVRRRRAKTVGDLMFIDEGAAWEPDEVAIARAVERAGGGAA